MQPTIFRFILKFSRRQQVLLLLLTVTSFPFLYLSLELPKTIINKAIGGEDFPRALLGMELEQVPYLMVLCVIFLALVFINGGFKYWVNVYKGVVGERMLRRLRYQLFEHALRFPLPHFRRISQGELVAMINAETEPLGGFVGDAVALPAFQGGTLLTILVFMFVQDPVLGTAAIALYPLQGWLIPKLQRRVNRLKKERVVAVRGVSERIGEVVNGIQEVHVHDTSRLELADFSRRMGEIYRIRFDIYRWKFLIKFLNNFIAQLTPFFFFSIGGYLVIMGDLTFGALVAVLAAYKDLSAPWKELLGYYERKEDARIKYELLIETFRPPGLLDERVQGEEPAAPVALRGELIVTNLDLREEGESEAEFAAGTSFRLDLGKRICIVGASGSGKERLAAALAGVRRPRAGSIRVGEHELTELPQSVTGRRIAYVGPDARMRGGTLRENLLYALKHRPLRARELDVQALARAEHERHEARLSGNSEHDPDDDWIDYEAAGLTGPAQLTDRTIEVLEQVDMARDVFRLGLGGTLDPETQGALKARILDARRALHDRLRDPEVAAFVEPFDRTRYNRNMSVAENLLFGTPCGESFDVENLAANAYVRKVLHELDLMPELLAMGRKVAALMLELFADVPPGSELFEQYSFIRAEDLPVFRALLSRVGEGDDLTGLPREDRILLLSLPLKLIPVRHRLGLVDERFQTRLLAARRAFAEGFGAGSPEVEFFDPERYNASVSIQDNILFGRLAYGKARSAAIVGALVSEVVAEHDLERDIMEVGLNVQVGVGGSRLSNVQRQKVAIARALLKRPDLLIIDEATAALDGASQTRVMESLFRACAGGGLIWVLHRASLAREFDHVLALEGGKVVEQGSFPELDRPGTLVHELAAAG